MYANISNSGQDVFSRSVYSEESKKEKEAKPEEEGAKEEEEAEVHPHP